MSAKFNPFLPSCLKTFSLPWTFYTPGLSQDLQTARPFEVNFTIGIEEWWRILLHHSMAKGLKFRSAQNGICGIYTSLLNRIRVTSNGAQNCFKVFFWFFKLHCFIRQHWNQLKTMLLQVYDTTFYSQ